MRGFVAHDGCAVAVLDEDERAVIARIVADVGLLLGAEPFGQDEPRRRPERDEPSDMLAFLDSLDEPITAPDDPALQRLLPNAAPTDDEVAEEFRRLTQRDLSDAKVARLRRLWELLDEDDEHLTVPADEVMGVAASLSDVRLVLASRLGVDSDEEAVRLHDEIEEAHRAIERGRPDRVGLEPERLWLGMLYDALTWLQETLVSVRLGGTDE